MVYDETALPLIEKLKAANEHEALATNALLDALRTGIKDNSVLSVLTERMSQAHANVMDIYEQLQPLRLDLD